MWIPFVFDNSNYLIKITKELPDISISLNDLKSIWKTRLSPEAVFYKFKECNPLCDVSLLEPADVVDQIASLGESVSAKTTVITRLKCEKGSNDELLVELKSNNEEFSTCFQFALSKTSDEELFKEFTLPLVQTVQYLETQNTLLCELLEKKDREIEEHRLEGGEITTRTNLITKKFDRESLQKEVGHELLLNVFGKSREFCDNFVSTHGADRRLFKQKREKAPVLPKKKVKTSRKYDLSSTGIPYQN